MSGHFRSLIPKPAVLSLYSERKKSIAFFRNVLYCNFDFINVFLIRYRFMQQSTTQKTEIEGYSTAQKLASSHYENFPVISVFLPIELRKHVAIIYWFARTADDIADEGNSGSRERTSSLEEMENKLSFVMENGSPEPLWAALKETIRQYELPVSLFVDLLSAFRQDITKTRYADKNEILDYCRRSANPIGRLLLHLFQVKGERAYELSDKICSALQLVNFYQDVSRDIKINRIYIPQELLKKFDIDEGNYLNGKPGEGFNELLEEILIESENMLKDGQILLSYLPFRLRIEIGFTIAGGLEIIKKIRNIGYQVYRIRPVLTKIDYLRLFIYSIRYGFIRSTDNFKGK